ncbi:energy-coupling factor ABC transporter ATP-binding protein [Paenirhodobacter sp.]|uniref:energy-coupling factor ABC transporter ATP-binding protein n=1 Tax=Paenirhodobacter sp. TaxID=1965326 RepID=UPI003B3F7EE8
MIEIEGLGFAYPGQPPLFQGLSLRLSGGALPVLGPNGQGKSTLLRLLAGLERPAAGQIRICGQGPCARLIGMVAQSSDRHFLRTRVIDEVALCARTLGLGDAGWLARAALERLGIGGLAGLHPLDLDTGQRRLTALAAAIAHRPRVLLLDEAQRGLDRLNRARLQALIAEEVSRGTAVLAVTHDTAFARSIAAEGLHVLNGTVARAAVAGSGDERPDAPPR